MIAFPVVVLAGGESRRIGGGKPLRMLGVVTLLERALRVARAWSDDVAVALRSPEQIGDAAVATLLDDPALEGPLGGLAAALLHGRDRSSRTVLTIACDMPFLPSNLAEWLDDALGDDVGVSLASSGGRLHPLCGLWRTEALDALPAYAATGKRSLHGFAEQIGFTAVAWPSDSFDPFFNVNDEADLRAAELRLSA